MSEDQDTLAAFADLDLDQFEEIRSDTLPMGVFGWEVTNFEFEPEDEDGDGNPRAKATFQLTVLEVQGLTKVVDESVKAGLVGRKHTENFYIKPEDFAAGVGRVRAFLTDIGGESSGKFIAQCEAAVGTKFVAGISHTRSKTDKSKFFARLKLAPKKKSAAAASV